MALLSPGVQVTVSDESQYQPTAAGTIPYILLATAQDKLNQTGATAVGTTIANAGKLLTITSQRELITTFGSPIFQQDANGNPINADERNEYGLLAAYSALGVANKIYVQRANVDLNALVGTSVRPTGTPPDGIYWLDQTATSYGLFEFSSSTGGFSKATVNTITDKNVLSGASPSGTPISSYGSIGDYAINSLTSSCPIYYKRYDNTWVLVGSDGWKLSRPTIVGTTSSDTIPNGSKIIINGSNITITGTSIAEAADAIGNVVTGVLATVNSVNQLELRVDGTSASSGNVSNPDGRIKIELGSTYGGTDAVVALGLFTVSEAAAGNVKVLNSPAVKFSDYRDSPAWKVSDRISATDPGTAEPTGSVWFKTSATGNGASWAFKQYNATTDSFTQLAAPIYEGDNEANYGLDPTGGGAGIAAGTVYVQYDTLKTFTASFKAYVKNVTGALKITSDVPNTSAWTGVGAAGDVFIMNSSVVGNIASRTDTITLTGSTGTTLVSDILAANIPNVVAYVETTGAISISHLAGGTIKFTEVSGTPLRTIGITGATQADCAAHVLRVSNSVFLATPWSALDYTYSDTAPFSNPVDGTLWYYSNPLEVDIMINDGSAWQPYKQVSNDARGYDLTLTDPLGPILSATRPSYQADGTTVVKAGDLWIDTSDLENYPVIYRYDGVSTWELIDNTDQVSTDGILFADARWGTNDDTDPITAALPTIESLANSIYLDDDAPSYALYARGTLLFNTRRSGYNVKRWDSTYFANASPLPAQLGAWVSYSGEDPNGVPYFGHKAQRNTIVEALVAAIESSVALREEQVEFNLICAPGYPELIGSMITLNNDRKNTAFIIGDSPLTLTSGSTTLEQWASNTNLAVDNGINGLVSRSEYLSVYYPSGYAKNLDGNSVVVPPSHMMLRTFIRSDNQSYPWFAPAGVRRGLLDNVTAIGYVDVADDSVFKSIGVTVGLRDTLYQQNVNPLTVLPGVGLVAYGQKTRAAMTSAMDRVNVARLVCYLRSVLDKVARPFIFEPNDTITRNQVKSSFEAVLNDIVAKRGIYDYLVVCDESNNTPDRIDRNELYVDIAIEPVKAIEFIYIPVRLKGTGDIAAGL